MKQPNVQLCLAFCAATALALTACDRKKPDESPAGARTEQVEWCAEHGVPEAACTRCHPKLIAEFKQKGDWCKDHNLPKSQCNQCDPSIKEKLEAMKPGA